MLPGAGNLITERPTFVTHLECSVTGAREDPDRVHGLSAAGHPLLVRYDLDGVAAALDAETLAVRPADMWRYREFLPVRAAADIVSLGETTTPLVPLGASLGDDGARVWVKDEGRLPTGSFKARGLAMAVSMASALGLEHLAMPTNGNAGAALAAYARRAGLRATVLCPADTPEVNVREIALQGGHVWRVDGLIGDCGRLVAEGAHELGWFDVSTLKEPYRIEGKKTMGLELAEQFRWQLPDVIFYPTGGGTGLIGMHKAFLELAELGWIEQPPPRMVAVQASGCAPIVRAFHDGADMAEPWTDAHTVASGIRVPSAIGDRLVLSAIADTDGFAIAVDDDAIEAARRVVGHDDGLLLCPEGAATFAGWRKARSEGLVAADESAVLFNCGSGLKYPMPPVDRVLDEPVDWDAFAESSGFEPARDVVG